METQTSQTSIPDGRFVAFRVRYELKQQKRSQRWLAREMNRGAQWMSRRVSGKVPFNVEEIQQVADILGVDVAAFFPPATPEARAS